MERIVIVGYRPLSGKNAEVLELMTSHWETLNREGLVSTRKPIVMQANDGTIIEVFGWKSKEAIEAAHTNIRVQKMWARFAEVCEYIPVGSVSESQSLFSEFTPLDKS